MSNFLRSLLRRSLKERGLLGSRRFGDRPRFRVDRRLLLDRGLLWPAEAIKPDKVHPRHKRPVEDR